MIGGVGGEILRGASKVRSTFLIVIVRGTKLVFDQREQKHPDQKIPKK